jgi:hypothetical protein
MKKLIAVAAMLSVMFFGFGTSQALVGMPDAVPGTHLIQPFFPRYWDWLWDGQYPYDLDGSRGFW